MYNSQVENEYPYGLNSVKRISATCLNHIDSLTKINRLLAAFGYLIAFKWANAQSLTSTIGQENRGTPGYLPFIVSAIISPEVKPAPTKAGPSIMPGFIITISVCSPSGKPF